MQHDIHRLQNLPDEIWAQVLGNVSMQDLLTTRLTARSFVRLSLLPPMTMDWQTATEEQAA